MQYYLGIDIGTTSSRAVAFSTEGELLDSAAVGYDMQHPEPNQSEQDPDEIVAVVITCINTVIRKLQPAVPGFLCFSAAMHSLIAVDDNGAALSPCIIWADNRAEALAEALKQTSNGKDFYHKTGVPIHPMSPLLKLLWSRENQPALFGKAAKFIGIKEYVFAKLFNEYVVDSSLASATGLLNIHNLQWDDAILAFAGISKTKLSHVVASDHIMYYNGTNATLNLEIHTPIIVGASDGALASMGSGTAKTGTMAVTIGTSGAVRKIVQQPYTDAQMRTFCYHINGSDFIIGGATNNGAVVLQWVGETLLKATEGYEALLHQAAAVPAGSEGLLFLPYLLGERAPVWNPKASGLYFGIHISHGKAHFIRAAIEGVIFNLYSIGKILMGEEEAIQMHASGGFAQSDLWLQILADVFNRKVVVPTVIESAAYGAVMLGAKALQLPFHFKQDFEANYLPNPEAHAIYRQQFKKFERLYGKLKDEMN